MELTDVTLGILQNPQLVAFLTGLITFIALLLGYVYIRKRQSVQEQDEQQSEKPSATVSPMSLDKEGKPVPRSHFSNASSRDEVWKKEAEITARLDRTMDKMKSEHGKAEMETMLDEASKGFGGCPVFHGVPKFQDVGKGSWPSGSDEAGKGGHGEGNEHPDPMEYCQHIPGQVKRTQQRVAMNKIEEDMSEDQKFHEREIQRKQLEDIFRLMGEQKDKFGVGSMDDINNQMNLYAQ